MHSGARVVPHFMPFPGTGLYRTRTAVVSLDMRCPALVYVPYCREWHAYCAVEAYPTRTGVVISAIEHSTLLRRYSQFPEYNNKSDDILSETGALEVWISPEHAIRFNPR